MSKSRRDIEIVWYPSRINVNIDVSSLLRVNRMALVGNFVAYISLVSVAPYSWILFLMYFLSNKVKVYVLGQVYQVIFSSVRGQTRNRKTLEAMWRLPFS
jgi:hypothetical protein